jgi:hypothetical protein
MNCAAERSCVALGDAAAAQKLRECRRQDSHGKCTPRRIKRRNHLTEQSHTGMSTATNAICLARNMACSSAHGTPRAVLLTFLDFKYCHSPWTPIVLSPTSYERLFNTWQSHTAQAYLHGVYTPTYKCISSPRSDTRVRPYSHALHTRHKSPRPQLHRRRHRRRRCAQI